MGEARTKARLETYVEEFEDDSEGMGLKEENHEGGGSQCPDETVVYESRLEWLKQEEGSHRDSIWKNIAEGEMRSTEAGEDEELVYMRVPGWFVNGDDDLSKVYTSVHDGQTVTGFAILRSEASEDADAYGFCNFLAEPRGWVTPMNQYKTAWIPKKVCTLYRRVGEPRPLDKEKVRDRDALPEEVDRFDADPEDYDWRLALGAAYRRCEGEEDSPVQQAYENAQELPKKLYNKVEIGVDEYMRQVTAENREVGEEELAMVINSLTKALTPGVQTEYEDED